MHFWHSCTFLFCSLLFLHAFPSPPNSSLPSPPFPGLIVHFHGALMPGRRVDGSLKKRQNGMAWKQWKHFACLCPCLPRQGRHGHGRQWSGGGTFGILAFGKGRQNGPKRQAFWGTGRLWQELCSVEHAPLLEEQAHLLLGEGNRSFSGHGGTGRSVDLVTWRLCELTLCLQCLWSYMLFPSPGGSFAGLWEVLLSAGAKSKKHESSVLFWHLNKVKKTWDGKKADRRWGLI